MAGFSRIPADPRMQLPVSLLVQEVLCEVGRAAAAGRRRVPRTWLIDEGHRRGVLKLGALGKPRGQSCRSSAGARVRWHPFLLNEQMNRQMNKRMSWQMSRQRPARASIIAPTRF